MLAEWTVHIGGTLYDSSAPFCSVVSLEGSEFFFRISVSLILTYFSISGFLALSDMAAKEAE